MKQKFIETIEITDPGDTSVGIFPARWEITGGIYIDDENVELFKDKIKEAFEFIADNPIVDFNFKENDEPGKKV